MSAWKDDVPDFDRRLGRITQTVLEQIESLNRIAGEFSAFAQMPVSQKERLNLDALIESVVDLFKESATIHYSKDASESEVYVKADADQLQRVLNNLIKNGIQAVSKGNPVINVALRKSGNLLHVTIADNGSGVPSDLADKIFTPNFTTKSSGMGLGLAIVRKIIEQHDGQIGFSNLPEGGAAFYFSLPIYEEKER
jgi:nitrogen fixation/metabolism regulation signal transduction histidine kinase